MKTLFTLCSLLFCSFAMVGQSGSIYGSSPSPYTTYNYTSTYPSYYTVPATTYVNGYLTQSGNYVNGHYKTTPDKTNHNNWSTTGNVNPYSGSSGTVARDYSPAASNYGSGRTSYTGPRGGQYYYNDNGNKIYVPKRN